MTKHQLQACLPVPLPPAIPVNHVFDGIARHRPKLAAGIAHGDHDRDFHLVRHPEFLFERFLKEAMNGG
jgi:hypothetical protein